MFSPTLKVLKIVVINIWPGLITKVRELAKVKEIYSAQSVCHNDRSNVDLWRHKYSGNRNSCSSSGVRMVLSSWNRLSSWKRRAAFPSRHIITMSWAVTFVHPGAEDLVRRLQTNITERPISRHGPGKDHSGHNCIRYMPEICQSSVYLHLHAPDILATSKIVRTSPGY